MMHSPELSAKNWALINASSPIQFIDSTFGNDLCDSIYNEEHDIMIFLPNTDSDKREDEKFDLFGIKLNISDEYGGDYLNKEEDNSDDFTLEEVLAYLEKKFGHLRNLSDKTTV
jgi:hypothetical protein